ncbi:MAG TPA: glycosyltransferase family 4 protein, partial [Moraxellaceae bacterium]
KRLFWRRGLRLVVTAHGGDFYARLPGAGWLMRWCMRQADVLTVVSHAMKQQAVAWGVPEARIVVASMGVDTLRFCPPPAGSGRRDIVFVGRLVEKKGVTHLLSAFARLLQGQPGLRLRIVGDGPLRPALEQQAQAAGISAAVTFLGARPPAEIPAVFQQAALFVMPSVVDSVGDREGLGLVLAEAMACGCPVVAHELDAVKDLVLQEETGLLVAQGDHVALAASMERLLGDEALRRRLAETALQRVRDLYAWPVVAARYRRVYDGA